MYTQNIYLIHLIELYKIKIEVEYKWKQNLMIGHNILQYMLEKLSPTTG